MKAILESAGNVGSRVRLGEHEMVFDQPNRSRRREPGPLPARPHGRFGRSVRSLLRGGVSLRPGPVDRRAERRGRVREGTRTRVADRTPRAQGPPPRRSIRPPAGGRRARDQGLPAYGTLLQPPRVEVFHRSARAGSRPAHRLIAIPSVIARLRGASIGGAGHSFLGRRAGRRRAGRIGGSDRGTARQVSAAHLRLRPADVRRRRRREGGPPGHAARGRAQREGLPGRIVAVDLAVHDRAQLLHQAAPPEPNTPPPKSCRSTRSATALPAAGPAPDEIASQREIRRALAGVIESLDPDSREVLVLRDIEGLTAPEVADDHGDQPGCRQEPPPPRAGERPRASGGEAGRSPGRAPPRLPRRARPPSRRSWRAISAPTLCANLERHVDTCSVAAGL